MFFVGFRIGAGVVDNAIAMVGRCVECVELQWCKVQFFDAGDSRLAGRSRGQSARVVQNYSSRTMQQIGVGHTIKALSFSGGGGFEVVQLIGPFEALPCVVPAIGASTTATKTAPIPTPANAKLCEKFAGPTTCHLPRPQFTTSPWRVPDCRYRLQSGAVGSFIDGSALH